MMYEAKVKNLFQYTHLPEHLQNVSKPFHNLALSLIADLPQSAELTLAIRSLWEAKNLVVFAKVIAKNKEMVNV
jgi:hypothetical protein